jgi:hypothetical protein
MVGDRQDMSIDHEQEVAVELVIETISLLECPLLLLHQIIAKKLKDGER